MHGAFTVDEELQHEEDLSTTLPFQLIEGFYFKDRKLSQQRKQRILGFIFQTEKEVDTDK